MNDKQKKFLLLRADGMSFDKIVKELNVSKPTLIQWSKLYADDINDLQFQLLVDLKEQYKYTQRFKYEHLLKYLTKTDEVLDQIDLSDIKFKDLMQIRNDLVGQLDTIEGNTVFKKTGIEAEFSYDVLDPVVMKLNEIS